MNVINIKCDFTKRKMKLDGVSVVVGDFNTTKLVFEFDQEYTGTKVCEIAKFTDKKNGNNEAIFVAEIVDNQVVLVTKADTTDEHGYVKYVDSEENVYWYDVENETLYDSSYDVSATSLDTLTKVQHDVSIFSEKGKYVLEISLYGEDSKLTSMYTTFSVSPEMVQVNDEEVESYLPLFDELMMEVTEGLAEMDNLNISVTKSGNTATVALTNKDGTTDSVNIYDGVSTIAYYDTDDTLTIETIGNAEEVSY